VAGRNEKVWRELTQKSLQELSSVKSTRSEYFDSVVRILQSWSGCSYVGIRLRNEEGFAPYESYVGFTENFIELEKRNPIHADRCFCTRTIAGIPDVIEKSYMTPEGSFYCNNIEQFNEKIPADAVGRYSGPCMTIGLKSVAIILCSHQGLVLGAIHIADEREDMMPIHVVNFVESLSPLFGEAFNKFKIESELKKTRLTVYKQENQFISLANYDLLTGLANRTSFIESINQMLLRGEYSKRLMAVLILGIDGFKFLNDNFGVDTGDEIIKHLASSIKTFLREGDLPARLGSDEFGLVLVDVAHKEDFIGIVDKLMSHISEPILINGTMYVLTVCIGISIYPLDGISAGEIMHNADSAITRAKSYGRNNYQFYTSDMNIKAAEFLRIERHLYGALANKEFLLYYQPYYDIETKRIVGFEALLRWKNRELGLCMPGMFIPILEETGLIIPVGVWIVRTVCEQINSWKEKGCHIVPISINLSGIQFRQTDLPDIMHKIILEYNIDSSLIVFELTESILMQDKDYALQIMNRIRNTGFFLSIDDFGTGYSSLGYINKFPFNYLKIDKSFVDEIDNVHGSDSIVASIISLSHKLNLTAIAEGVESEEQFNILRRLECDFIQGYYMNRPLISDDAEKILKEIIV
jgi:diguanylate cyclase (GGDEF)-like protein